MGRRRTRLVTSHVSVEKLPGVFPLRPVLATMTIGWPSPDKHRELLMIAGCPDSIGNVDFAKVFLRVNNVIVKATSQAILPQVTTKQRTAKILHLINGEHFSGAERVQDLLAMALPEYGYEVGFACVKPDKFPKVRESTHCELFATHACDRNSICVASQKSSRFFKSMATRRSTLIRPERCWWVGWQPAS